MKPLRFSILFQFALFSIFALTLASETQAEPWTSNRFAQNCAACHAPARFNLPPKDRRCTLTCQGCHVNPNGGGLRNEYGIWNQQRWLRSFRSDALLGNPKTPAPHYYQNYLGKKIKNVKAAKKAAAVRRAKRLKPKNKKVHWQKFKKGEYPKLTVTTSTDVPDEDYDHFAYTDWLTDATSLKQFKSRLTKDDPWRLERQKMVLAGGDIRTFYGQMDGKINGVDIADDNKTMSGVMAADIGVRVRPIPQHLQLVIETRYINNPFKDTNPEDGFKTPQARSAYVLSDYLPWNTWVMAGLYRPHFGHYNPDHNTLAQEISGFGYSGTVKALGIGTAPNVPFINVHLIQKSSGYDQEGINVNAGARFVTLGASGKLSYWSTKDSSENKTNMLSASMGGMLWHRLIGTYEMLRIEKEYPNGKKDSGNVNTLELKYRFWRENYFMLNYALSNVALSVEKGTASEALAGVKSFLLPGIEVEASYILRQNDDKANSKKSDYNIAQLQFHYFF